MRRGRGWLLASIAVLICVCLAGVFALRVRADASPPLAGQVVIPAGQKPAPNFVLHDQYGRAVSLAGLRGRVVALTFLDSHCTHDCPVLGRELTLVARRLGPAIPWTLLVVSVAPYTDSPASSANFALKAGWRMDWRWLFGTPSELAKVWKAYGIWVDPTPTDILHTAAIYLIAPDQNVRVADMVPFMPDEMIQSIRALASSPSRGWQSWIPSL